MRVYALYLARANAIIRSLPLIFDRQPIKSRPPFCQPITGHQILRVATDNHAAHDVAAVAILRRDRVLDVLFWHPHDGAIRGQIGCSGL